MRIAALVAGAVLIAGCTHTINRGFAPDRNTTQVSGASPTTTAGTQISTVSEVIASIEAGHQADPGRYHSATRDGAITQLGSDIAFTSAAGAVVCMTDSKHTGGAMSCLVKLTNPPPRPETAYGDWKGGWVDFDGATLQVGSARADPGPFIYGDGPELANGDSLSFGDYRCRADQAGAVCVNYARQSAVRFGPAGIEPFGCLRSVPPPDGVGIAFAC
jgi:hypothetical protein